MRDHERVNRGTEYSADVKTPACPRFSRRPRRCASRQLKHLPVGVCRAPNVSPPSVLDEQVEPIEVYGHAGLLNAGRCLELKDPLVIAVDSSSSSVVNDLVV